MKGQAFVASILIIDDDPVYGDMMKQRLERAGHRVTLHLGPFGATVAARRSGIDLIILDVFMPALGGPDLLELMRQNNPDSPAKVIFCSSMDVGPLRAISELHRADGFIPKSAGRLDLLKLVTSLVKARETPRKSD